ncbi:hypothetical protein TNCV_1546681 [Trichonephila clavipes]|nr:hypothetical protein TNCV_1546681 [Trichonephila clavipes]
MLCSYGVDMQNAISVEVQSSLDGFTKIAAIQPIYWLVTLTAAPKGLGSNPRDIDVCKCIGPLRQGDSLNNSRAASPLVRLLEEEERGRPLVPRVFSIKVGVELSQIIMSPEWCSKLRLTTGVQPAPRHDEFRRL